MFNRNDWERQAHIISEVLSRAPGLNKEFRIGKDEFARRQLTTYKAIEEQGFDCGIVYSDEHYCGDVPYLGGNTNINIEPVAGIIGKNGFYLMAGLEGGYVAEQLAPRSGCKVTKVEMLKLADEEYPVDAMRVEDVIEECVGYKPRRIALLTPRQVLPLSIYEFLCDYAGSNAVFDAQKIYYKIKYEKSDSEMRAIEQASLIADVMMEGMLSIMKPGMYETQVAQWGYAIASELGVEDHGFDVMVTSGEANRTLIGKALNRRICEGDYVHIGVAPKVDGLTACERATVICVDSKDKLTESQKYWINFVESAFKTGLEAYIRVAKENLPARLQEQALVDFFAAHESEVCKRLGKKIDFVRQKPYTGTHNSGYTECQEFYGAITLNSNEPLGNQIVTMLDVAVRGFGSRWDDIVIPGFDYALVEKTLGKYGNEVKVLNKLPVNLQHFVGRGF